MPVEFYGATTRSIAKINQLLKIDATGREQDWEFEFADPEKINQIVNLLCNVPLDVECQSAAALLLLASIDEAGEVEMDDELRVKKWLCSNRSIQEEMRFYWLKLKRANHHELIEKILHCD